MAGCYHIWKSAPTGNALFRVARCYPTKSAVDAAIRRWRKHPPTRVKHDGHGNPLNDAHGNPVYVRPPAEPIMMALKCHGVDDDTTQAICPCACAKADAAAARELDAAIRELSARRELDTDAADMDTPARQAV